MAVMTGRTTPAPCPFTSREREYIRKRKPMATYRIGCLAVRLFRPDVSGLMSMIG